MRLSAQARLFRVYLLDTQYGTYTAGLFGIPEGEELVKGPLDTLNPLLLALGGVFVGKGQGVDVGPVWEQVEVEQAQVGEQDGYIGRGRSGDGHGPWVWA